MIVQSVKLLVVIGIMKALSYHNGRMHINTQKMVCHDQYMFLQRYFIMSYYFIILLSSLCS